MKIEKKPNICWTPKCEKKHEASFNLKLGRATFSGKFCTEHFRKAWSGDNFSATSFVETFLKYAKDEEK